MALRYYENIKTGEIIKSLKKLDSKEYKEVLYPPSAKFQVCANPETGRSKIKDNQGELLERSRNHSRDHELDHLIDFNRKSGIPEVSINTAFLNDKGEKRTKLDDL